MTSTPLVLQENREKLQTTQHKNKRADMIKTTECTKISVD